MAIQQLSVFMENRPGQLLEGSKLFAENNINLRALMIAETSDYGVIRLITEDNERAFNILKEHGWVVQRTEVIAVAVRDNSGGMLPLLKIFSEHNISIEYMYSILGNVTQKGSEPLAYMIIKVNDVRQAESLLKENNITVIERG